VTRTSLLSFVILAVTLSACTFDLPIKSRTKTVNPAVIKVPPEILRSKSGNPTSYIVFGKRYYVMDNAHGFVQRGIASWYGKKFHGRKTSSGEVYDMHAMTAAHKELPLPSYVRVVNIKNGRTIVVKVNDRGPFVGGRIIDLSFTAASQLGIVEAGTGEVEISVLNSPGSEKRPVVRTIPLVENIAENVPLFIQLGSFGVELNAQNLVKHLHDSNEPSAKVYKLTDAKGTFYRVRLGPLYDINESNAVVIRLQQKGFEKARVVLRD
tara:strand:- start:4315 stop:5112 length:798 start_codon:yes stop_codon:yes gene_type:complete